MKLLYTVLLVALSSAVFAQSNYHEGYVVKNNGDTLKGFINYREWEQCPVSIDFKASKTDNHSLKFNPHTIKEFQINGMETYVTYKGIISMDRTKFPDLPLALDTSKRQDTIFLKVAATGKYLTLFYHKDAVKIRFFVAENNIQPVELKYSQYYDTQNQLAVNEAYKRQLIYYINKFAPQKNKLNNQTQSARYNLTDLESLTSDVNNNQGAIKKESNYRLFAGFGLNSNKTEVDDDGTILLPKTSFSKTLTPQVNFGIDLFVNPNVQRLIFRTEVSLSYINADFSDLRFTFRQTSVMVTPQLLLSLYNKDYFKLYIDGGIRFNFSSYTASSYIDWASPWASLPILQVGVIMNKKTELSFTYIPYQTYTRYTSNFNIMSQSMGLGFRYFFGNK